MDCQPRSAQLELSPAIGRHLPRREPVHRRRRRLLVSPHHRRAADEQRQVQRRRRYQRARPRDRRHSAQAADPEPVDEHRRLQGHGDRATPQCRKRSDHHAPDRHGTVLFRRPEERGFHHAQGQSVVLGWPTQSFGGDLSVHLRTDDGAFSAASRRDRLDRLDPAAASDAAARRRLDQLGGHREQRLLVSRAQRGTQAVERRAGASGHRLRHRPGRDRGGDELRHRRGEPARDPQRQSLVHRLPPLRLSTSRRPRPCCRRRG